MLPVYAARVVMPLGVIAGAGIRGHRDATVTNVGVVLNTVHNVGESRFMDIV